jgi:soluble lytic murein transglycosylase-like protein
MLSPRNKTVYICFLLALLMTVATPSRAAEVSPAPNATGGAVTPAATGRKTFVVRADPRTGKLVRSLVVAPSLVSARPAGQTPATAPAKAAIRQMVEQSARNHNVDPLLVDAVIKVESNYNPHAVSRVGAQGLMQLMPGTARDLGVSNSFDPGQNIEAGVRYLKHLQNLYKDDRLALAAYNAGPGAVDKYKQIPPYPETQNYVYQVGKRYGEARVAAANERPASKPVAPPVVVKEEEKHPKLDSFVDQNGRLHLRTTQ